MSCGNPSRALFKAATATCPSTSGPCAPCPVGTSYSLPASKNLCCDDNEWIETIPEFLNITLGTGSLKRLRYKITGKTCEFQCIAGQTSLGTIAPGLIRLKLPVLPRIVDSSNILESYTVANGYLATAPGQSPTFFALAHLNPIFPQYAALMFLAGGAPIQISPSIDPSIQSDWYLAISGSYEIA